MAQPVEDKRAELGINISVVIQGCILIAISGFGNYIVGGLENVNDTIKELTQVLSRQNRVTTVNTNLISRNSEDIEDLSDLIKDHIDDDNLIHREK